MDKGAYELIRLLIQNVDAELQLELADGTSRTLHLKPETLLNELNKGQNLEKEANWLADKLAEFDCPCPCSEEEAPPLEECAECWREAARKAVGDKQWA